MEATLHALPKITTDSFDILELIGEGSFGRVFRAIISADGLEVALKCMDRRMLQQKNELKSLYREKRVLRAARNKPCIIRLYGSFCEAEGGAPGAPSAPGAPGAPGAGAGASPVRAYEILFMEYALLGDLTNVIKCYGRLPIEWVRFLAAELVVALEGLHAVGYAHRDVKPMNVLLSRDGHVRLTDFGTAKELSPDEQRMVAGERPYVRPSAPGSVPAGPGRKPDGSFTTAKLDRERAQSIFGTALYNAPEAGMGTTVYLAPLDVWGLGCCIYEVFVGQPPFFATTETSVAHLIESKNIQLARGTPADLADLLKTLLHKDPVQRFQGGWPAVRAHRFFKGVDFAAVHKTPPPYDSHRLLHDIIKFRSYGIQSPIPPDAAPGALGAGGDGDPLGALGAPGGPLAEHGPEGLRRFLLSGERILRAALVTKRRRLKVPKTRILLLSDFPRVVYIDPGPRGAPRLVRKGEVSLSSATLSITRTGARVIEFMIKEDDAFEVELESVAACEDWLRTLLDLATSRLQAAKEVRCDRCDEPLQRNGFCTRCGYVVNILYHGAKTIDSLLRLDPRWIPLAAKELMLEERLKIVGQLEPEGDIRGALGHYTGQPSALLTGRSCTADGGKARGRGERYRNFDEIFDICGPAAGPGPGPGPGTGAESGPAVGAATGADTGAGAQQAPGGGWGTVAHAGTGTGTSTDADVARMRSIESYLANARAIRRQLVKLYYPSYVQQGLHYPAVPLPRVLALCGTDALQSYATNMAALMRVVTRLEHASKGGGLPVSPPQLFRRFVRPTCLCVCASQESCLQLARASSMAPGGVGGVGDLNANYVSGGGGGGGGGTLTDPYFVHTLPCPLCFGDKFVSTGGAGGLPSISSLSSLGSLGSLGGGHPPSQRGLRGVPPGHPSLREASSASWLAAGIFLDGPGVCPGLAGGGGGALARGPAGEVLNPIAVILRSRHVLGWQRGASKPPGDMPDGCRVYSRAMARLSRKDIKTPITIEQLCADLGLAPRPSSLLQLQPPSQPEPEPLPAPAPPMHLLPEFPTLSPSNNPLASPSIAAATPLTIDSSSNNNSAGSTAKGWCAGASPGAGAGADACAGACADACRRVSVADADRLAWVLSNPYSATLAAGRCLPGRDVFCIIGGDADRTRARAVVYLDRRTSWAAYLPRTGFAVSLSLADYTATVLQDYAFLTRSNRFYNRAFVLRHAESHDQSNVTTSTTSYIDDADADQSVEISAVQSGDAALSGADECDEYCDVHGGARGAQTTPGADCFMCSHCHCATCLQARLAECAETCPMTCSYMTYEDNIVVEELFMARNPETDLLIRNWIEGQGSYYARPAFRQRTTCVACKASVILHGEEETLAAQDGANRALRSDFTRVVTKRDGQSLSYNDAALRAGPAVEADSDLPVYVNDLLPRGLKYDFLSNEKYGLVADTQVGEICDDGSCFWI